MLFKIVALVLCYDKIVKYVHIDLVDPLLVLFEV
jgi:hypothetical protein